MVTRRTFTSSLLAGAVALPMLNRLAAAQQSASLALDWYPNANHIGLYRADSAGYFQQSGVDLAIQVPADPTTVLATVGAGRDTFGISYQADVLFARSQGVPVKSVAALVQHPLNCLMFRDESGINRPADLAGKSVGVTGLPSDDALLRSILASDGLTTDDVTVINVGYDLLPAILGERADAVLGAYWTHETILAEHQGTPVRYLRVEEWGVPDYYELVLVAGDTVIDEHPDLVSSVLGAMQQGYAEVPTDPEGSLQTLLEQNPDLDAEVEAEGLNLLMPLWTDNGTVPFGDQQADRWESFASWLIENNLLDADVDVAGAWNGSLLPESSAATPQASPAS